MKQTLTNLLKWLISLGLSLASSVSIIYYFEDTWKFIDASQLPENPAAAVMGGFFGTVFGCLFNLSVFFIALILIFVLKKPLRIRRVCYSKKDTVAQKAVTAGGYLLAGLFFYHFISDIIQHQEFILSGMVFYTAAILTTFCYLFMIKSFIEPAQI